jgi:uncharacterized protein YybS (DUF2232 family)
MSQDRKNFSGQFYLLSIFGTALFFIISSLPNGFAWLYFFTPLPVIYFVTILGFQRGLKIITYAALIAGVVALASGGFRALLYAFSLIPTGVILARSINRREQVFRAGLSAVIILGATWLVLGLAISAVSHQNLYQGILQNIDAELTNAFDTYSKSPDFPADSKAELTAVFTRMRQMVPRIFPGSLMISAIFTIWLNMLLSNGLLKKNQIAAWEEFQFWRLPEQLVWLLIAGALFSFVPSGFLPILGVNIVLVLSALYFFQGLAVITNLFGRWSIPRPIKFLIFFVMTIQAYGIILLALLGVADIWVNFRKPKLDKTT